MKPHKTIKGYYQIVLYKNGKAKRYQIHRLVAKAFIKNSENKPTVNHIDGNKLNNVVDNLEWCTSYYNMTYGTLTERRVAHTDYSKPCYRENAIKNGKTVCRPVERYTKSGEYIDSFESATDAKRKLKLKSTHITECCKFQRKSSNGYVWRYERRNDLSDFQF